MSGYTDCACRDCFDVAIGVRGEELCSACEDAGCFAEGAMDGLQGRECQREDAYGISGDEGKGEGE